MPRTALDTAVAAFSRIAPRLVRAEAAALADTATAGERVTLTAGEQTVTVYVHRVEDSHAPVLFELHGGGFALGTAQRDDMLREALKTASGACVIGIDYPKAPLHPYPAAIETAAAVIRNVCEHAAAYGIDPARCGVAGFSAGGNLAAVLAAEREKRRLPIIGQLLFYPYLDLASDEADKPRFPTDMPVDQMRIFRRLYCAEAERGNPDVSPALADAAYYAAAPDAFFVLAAHDALCEEGARYAEMLRQAGVPVTVRYEDGMHHGFIEDAYVPPQADLRRDTDKTLWATDSRQRAAEDIAAAGAWFGTLSRRQARQTQRGAESTRRT